MPNRRTTFSKFIIEDLRRRTSPEPGLAALLTDLQIACKFIASAASRGKLYPAAAPGGSAPSSIAETANDIMLRESEWGGQLCGIVSADSDEPIAIPAAFPSGPYLLTFSALEGATNLDIGRSAGTIFSVLRAPGGTRTASAADFLQPGVEQLAAGFALYGPTSTIVITLGSGVHGFTLDREIGAYTLTEPDMRIDRATRNCAVDSANQRTWEPPVRHYVEECIAGASGGRGDDVALRWADSLAAETYRILVRGGISIYPADLSDPAKAGRLHLLYEANPIAMIVEQASGSASTGRSRILETAPLSLHQRVPMIFGARDEVARINGYHEAFDRGETFTFENPLFNARSLFRAS